MSGGSANGLACSRLQAAGSGARKRGMARAERLTKLRRISREVETGSQSRIQTRPRP